MKKINVIYWSGSGNTEMMAEAIASGAKSAGADVRLLEVSAASIEDYQEADVVALGCPSMGNEVLEESDMEPYVCSIEAYSDRKALFLFGSYGWGDGEWMRNWDLRMADAGAQLIHESLILNETPDANGIEQCREIGKKLAQG